MNLPVTSTVTNTAANNATGDRSSSSNVGSLNSSLNAGGLAAINTILQRDIAGGRIPGAVLLVAHQDRVVHQAVLGMQDPVAGKPMQADTIFRIYSMTKPIVSVALMMLVEEGRLLISDPVSKYLPELAGMQVGLEQPTADGASRLQLVPASRETTVQDLLRHTSGLTYGLFGDSLVKAQYRASPVEGRGLNNQSMLSALAQLPLAYQPGTVWEYSRSTDVLGALLERITGQTLDVALAERILQPLQMPDTGFWVPPAQQHRLAEAFPLDPDSGKPVRMLKVTSKPDFLSGGGGMVSTAGDYLRFARMLANGGTLDGMRILSSKTLAFMTSDHLAELPLAKSGPSYLPGPGYGFGLGFAVRTSTGNAYTPGSVGDYNWSGLGGTYFWVDPVEELVVIWMMQAPEQRGYYRQLVRNLVYAAR